MERGHPARYGCLASESRLRAVLKTNPDPDSRWQKYSLDRNYFLPGALNSTPFQTSRQAEKLCEFFLPHDDGKASRRTAKFPRARYFLDRDKLPKDFPRPYSKTRNKNKWRHRCDRPA